MKKTIITGIAIITTGLVYFISGNIETEKCTISQNPKEVYASVCKGFSKQYDIPDNAERVIISTKRISIDDKGVGVDTIQVQSDYFNGQEWTGGPGFTTDGGQKYDDKNQPITESYVDTPIPEGKGRKINVRVISLIDMPADALTVSFELR